MTAPGWVVTGLALAGLWLWPVATGRLAGWSAAARPGGGTGRSPAPRRWGAAARWWPPARGVEEDDVPVARCSERLATLLTAGLAAPLAWRHAAAAVRSPSEEASGRQGDVADAVAVAALAAQRGDPVQRALRSAAGRCRDPADAAGTLALAAAWQVGTGVGAPLGPVLHALAARLRQEAAARDARAVALSGPRATARVLTWLPPVGLLVGWAVGAEPVRVLTTTAAGAAAASLGAVLAAAGWLWSRRLLAAAERG